MAAKEKAPDRSSFKAVDGLRLKNSRFFCFLNSAVNAVVSNPILLNRIMDPNNDVDMDLSIVTDHSTAEDISKINFENGAQSLRNYVTNAFGCIDFHGADCFSAIKKAVMTKLSELDIVDQIRLLVLKNCVNDTIVLRHLLCKRFPVFKPDVQHDSGDAYLSIVQCLSEAQDICSLRISRTRKCCDCGDVATSISNEEWCIMLKRVENSIISLQDAISQWENQSATLSYDCECKLKAGVWTKPELYYSKHIDSFQVIGAPQVLHIKVKDRSVRESGITISDTFF